MEEKIACVFCDAVLDEEEVFWFEDNPMCGDSIIIKIYTYIVDDVPLVFIKRFH